MQFIGLALCRIEVRCCASEMSGSHAWAHATMVQCLERCSIPHTPGDTGPRLHCFCPRTDRTSATSSSRCVWKYRNLRRKIAMIGHRMLCQRSACLRSRPFVPISRSAHRSIAVRAQQTSALPRLQPLDGTVLKLQLKIRVHSSPLLVHAESYDEWHTFSPYANWLIPGSVMLGR